MRDGIYECVLFVAFCMIIRPCLWSGAALWEALPVGVSEEKPNRTGNDLSHLIQSLPG